MKVTAMDVTDGGAQSGLADRLAEHKTLGAAPREELTGLLRTACCISWKRVEC